MQQGRNVKKFLIGKSWEGVGEIGSEIVSERHLAILAAVGWFEGLRLLHLLSSSLEAWCSIVPWRALLPQLSLQY